MENLVENSNDSRSTKSRNAKVSQTGRNLEDSSSWQPGGIPTKPPLCKSLDEVGRSLEGWKQQAKAKLCKTTGSEDIA